MKHFLFISSLIAVLLLVNCTTTNQIKSFNNTSTPVGKPKHYQSTKNFAIHVFFGAFPITPLPQLGNANFEQTLEDFTSEAVKSKNQKIYIIQKETTNFWFLIPVLTWIFTPISTEITGFVQE